MKTIYNKLLFLLLMLPFSVLAQSTVEGVVVDSKTKQPLPGVNVIVQGTQSGTSTDFDGKFKLAKLKKGDKLVFSFIGYKNETIVFENQKTLTVSLSEESNLLQEVVVQVGYGSVKKKDATGAVDLLTTKDLNRGFNSNAESLLTGRVAGVVVTSGGRPGDGAAIRIRGGSSLGASNDPLIVLDGLPLDNSVAGSNGILSALNPNDIESYSILKDASATAIYGSRGSNGVILITTKKGAKGDVKVSVGTTMTVNTLAKKVDVLSASEFRAFVSNPANVAAYIPDSGRLNRMGTASTDWQDEIFSNSVSIDNNVSIKGEMFKKIPTYFAYGHTYVPGILETSKFDRTNTSLKLNPSFFDNHLKVAVNANFTVEKNRFADQGAIGSAISFDPTQSVYDANSPFGGYFEWFKYLPLSTNVDYSLNGRVTLASANPVALLQQRNNTGKAYRYFGNIQLDYKFHFLPDLKATIIGGIDNQHGRGWDEISNQSKSGFIQNNLINYGSYSTYWQKRKNKLLDSYLNYSKKFGSINVDVTGGYSYQYFESYGNSTGNIYDTNPSNTLANQSRIYINPDVNLQSYFGRANIGLADNKYLLTLNYRRDGSSRFSELHRWGNFPGAALAWNVSREDFLKDSKSLTNLKLRLGWGVTGQQDVPASYEYIPRYVLGNATAQYQFGNTFYITGRPNGYNEDIKWEETTTLNAGIDFGIFSRIKGNLDVYRKDTKDLLAFVSYPDGANLANSGYRNFGNMRSQGVELGINYEAIKGENLNWNINFNANYQDRKITALAGDAQSGFPGYPTGGFSTGDFIQIQTTGFAPNSFYVYEQVYGANGKPLEGVYVDRNGDGTVNKNDMYQHKKPYADFTFGLMSNLSYKKWDMSMAWRASLGNYIYDDISGSRGYASQSFGEITPLNNISPSFIETGFVNQGGDREFSDYYIKDASFIKLDNVSVGYNFSEPFGKSTTARLSFGVQNALIITKYKGIDPEVFSGIDNVIYPRARMYVMSCNVNF